MASSYIVACAAGGALAALVILVACSAPDATPGPDDAADAGADTDGDGPAQAATSATFVSLTARAVGRTGGDLQIVARGEDPTLTAYGIHIRMHDAANGTVLAFVGNWNGAGPGVLGPQAADRRVLFDPSDTPAGPTFERTTTLPGLLRSYPSIANVEVAVLTKGNHHSNKLSGPVDTQPEKALGEPCDAALVTDRCVPALACTGSPTICTIPSKPTLSRFAYIPAPEGAHLLFAGPDPAGEVTRIHVEFLNAGGVATLVDTTGNGDFARFKDLSLGPSSSYGAFFLDHQAPPGFDSSVPRLAATPIGASSGAGARSLARLAAAPQAAVGEACDPDGFIACTSGNTCAAGPTAGTSVCSDLAAAQASVLASAPTLDPSAGVIAALGYARTSSLWDPPASCVSSGSRGRPEGVVHLHLSDPLKTLSISTAYDVTSFDTIVYLLPNAGGPDDTPLGCNDDTFGTSSLLTVTDLAAGDYTIVVDSKTRNGGAFGLKIKGS